MANYLMPSQGIASLSVMFPPCVAAPPDRIFRLKVKSSQKRTSEINCNFGMKVHLIRKESIKDFAKHNAQSRTSFTDWLSKIKYADWEDPANIQDTFPGADLRGIAQTEQFLI